MLGIIIEEGEGWSTGTGSTIMLHALHESSFQKRLAMCEKISEDRVMQIVSAHSSLKSLSYFRPTHSSLSLATSKQHLLN